MRTCGASFCGKRRQEKIHQKSAPFFNVNTKHIHEICLESRQSTKSSLNVKFLGGISRGRPGGYLGGRPSPKGFTPSLGAQENKVYCADILDPKERTSMTRWGSQKNFMQENFGLNVWSLLMGPSPKVSRKIASLSPSASFLWLECRRWEQANQRSCDQEVSNRVCADGVGVKFTILGGILRLSAPVQRENARKTKKN